MAKSSAFRWWTGFGEQAKRKPKPKKKGAKPKGITNKQAKFLALLQRKAGEKYTGNGMTSRQASKEIDRLLHPVKVSHLDREWEERAARDE